MVKMCDYVQAGMEGPLWIGGLHRAWTDPHHRNVCVSHTQTTRPGLQRNGALMPTMVLRSRLKELTSTTAS